MVNLSKEGAARLLRNLLEKLEDKKMPVQTGEVKAVSFEKAPLKGTLLKEGQLVFTPSGVGIFEGASNKKRNGRTLYAVRLRRSGRKQIVFFTRGELMKLVIQDEEGDQLPISPMFYDHLIASIGKEVEYYVNVRNTVMLTRKQQDLLTKDKLASIQGAYNFIKACKEQNLLW